MQAPCWHNPDMARGDTQINIRIPEELKEQLDAAAVKNRRSLTAEVVARLQETLKDQRTPEDLLSELREVAAAIAGGPTPTNADEARLKSHLVRQAALRDQLAAKLASAQARSAHLQYLIYSAGADGLNGDDVTNLKAEREEVNDEIELIRGQLDAVIRQLDKAGAW